MAETPESKASKQEPTKSDSGSSHPAASASSGALTTNPQKSDPPKVAEEVKSQIVPTPEQMMWVDPIHHNHPIQSGSVLLADVIREYVKKDLLISKDTFDEKQLKGASYAMRPAIGDAWMFLPGDEGEDKCVALDVGKDDEGEYYDVPKNALVYIRLREKLRVPFYVIGRHNLKIRYVYKGLLLGTGPQVDPGYVGQLYIPLHNFTAKKVRIYLEKSFVSIDFSWTTAFLNPTESPPKTTDELYAQFEKSKCLIKREKVDGRTTLEKYLEKSTPRSQMAQFQREFNEASNTVKDYLRSAKRLAFIERVGLMVGIAAVMYASLTYYFGFVADLKTETERVKGMGVVTNISTLQTRVSVLEQRVSTLSATNNATRFENQLTTLESQLEELRKQTATVPAVTNETPTPKKNQ